MRRTIAIVAVTLAFALGVWAMPAPAQEIPVGAIGTLTGKDTDVNGMAYGPRDYFKYLNDKQGGIMGHKVKCTLLDGHNEMPEEVKHFKRLTEIDQVVGYINWGTGSTKSLRDQANKIVKIPFMTQSLTGEVVDPVNLPFSFIFGPTYEDQIKIALSYMKEKGAKTMLYLHNDIEYGKAPVRVAMKEGFAEKMGLKSLGNVEYAWTVTDVTPQLLRVKEMNPDFIYIQDSANNTTLILRDAAKVGIPPSKFIGNNYNFNPTILATLGDKCEGFQTITINEDYGANIPMMKEIEEFGKSNEIPKKDAYYIRGWAEGKVLGEAIRRVLEKTGGKLPPTEEFRLKIRDELENLANFDVGGAVPPITYKNHQGYTLARISQVQKGKFVPITPFIDSKK